MRFAIGTTLLLIMVSAGSSKANGIVSSSQNGESSQVKISVFDRANVAPELLMAAEEEASRVFVRAGIAVTWMNCSKPLDQRGAETPTCGTIGAGYLVAEILPNANGKRFRSRLEVEGAALLIDKEVGYYFYVFYDRIAWLAGERHLPKNSVLGDVLAHEAGHLLLGSNLHSVSGIMSGDWSGNGLRLVSQGGMGFDPAEARIMRERLNAKRAPAVAAAEPRLSDADSSPNEPTTSAAETSPEDYTVLNATATQEATLRAQIRLMHPPVPPLRVIFYPHWKYQDAARIFRVHTPTGYIPTMFTHMPIQTVFIDRDRYRGPDWLGYWMAHELGHLAANSASEEDAERAAKEFRKRLKESRN